MTKAEQEVVDLAKVYCSRFLRSTQDPIVINFLNDIGWIEYDKEFFMWRCSDKWKAL